jgi:fibronectin-binding autotransporter adhesin
MKQNLKLAKHMAIAFTALLAIPSGYAANETWDGGDADDNFWQSNENWLDDSAPLATDTLFFGGTTRLNPVNDYAGGTQFNGITFNAGAGAFVLSGNAITLGGNVTNNELSNEQTIALDMDMGGTLRAFGGNGNTTMSGILAGSAGVAKNGTGVLTFSNANTYSGGTDVNGGTLRLTNFNALQNSFLANLETGTTLQLRSDTSGTFATAIGVNNVLLSGTIDVGPTSSGTNQTLTFGGNAITFNNTINFTGSAGYRAGLGNLAFGDTNARTMILNPTTANVTIASMNLTGGGFGQGIRLEGTSDDNRIGQITRSNGVTLTKNSTSTWTLTGNNSTGASDKIIVNAGKLILAAGTTTTWGSSTETVNGGTLQVDGTLTNGVIVNDTGILSGVGSTGAATINAGGRLAPGSVGKGALGTGNLFLPGTLSAEISKASSGSQPVSGTDYDRVNVTGTVNLTGGDLELTIGTGLELGDVFYLIANNGTDAITGTFSTLNGTSTDLSEGASFTLGGYNFVVTYQADAEGGAFTGGNDVGLLVAVPEPHTALVVLLVLGMLVTLRRPRLVRA